MKPNLSLTSERIRKIIESKGLTLERFGDLIGDTPISSVNNWLRGVSLPNKNRLLTIANIGNTSVDWIKWGTLEEYIASYLIDSGYELYIKDFPEIPYKVFKDIQEKYSDTFSLDKDYELLDSIIKNIFTKYYSNGWIDRWTQRRKFKVKREDKILWMFIWWYRESAELTKKSLVFMNDRFVNLIEIDLYDFGIWYTLGGVEWK